MTKEILTAYQESLIEDDDRKNNPSIVDTFQSRVPSYMVAADTLNIGNGNKTFIESAADAVDSVPKFIGLSILSGANQLYNIPADVGNLFGAEMTRVNTEDIVSSLDSDLGKFYTENQGGIDLVGFIASSMVPGTAGVKILNAGQRGLSAAVKSGKYGGNIGKAMGLLDTVSKKRLVAKAVEEVSNGTTLASLTNSNAIKAIGAGAGANFLEAAAFEVAVAGTMFNSPVLEDQDFGDLMSNIAWGGALFGVIGGAIDGAKINSALKGAAKKSDLDARPYTFREGYESATNEYESIALSFEQLENMPPVLPNIDPKRVEQLNKLRASTVVKLEQQIQTDIGTLSRGDEAVHKALYDGFKGASAQDAQTAFMGLVEVSGFSKGSPIATRIANLQEKAAKGKIPLVELEELQTSTVSIGYAKAWGDDAGTMYSEANKTTQLIDTLKSGESIKPVKGGIKVTGSKGQDRFYKFSTKYNTFNRAKLKPNKKGELSKEPAPWNIFTSTVEDTNARYMWVHKLAKFKPTAKAPLNIHVDDIPMMEKILFDTALEPEALNHVRFRGLKEGEHDVLSQGLEQFIIDRKESIAIRLLSKGADAINPRTGVAYKSGLTQEQIAAKVNVKNNYLSGEQALTPKGETSIDDAFAYQTYSREYTQGLVDKGIRSANSEKPPVQVWDVPQNIKMVYDTRAAQRVKTVNGKQVAQFPDAKTLKGTLGTAKVGELDNFVIENMATLKTQQRLYKDGMEAPVTMALGPDAEKLVDLGSGFGGMVEQMASTVGAGHKFLTAASSNYGSLAAFVENLGSQTTAMISKAKKGTAEAMESSLIKLGNNREASIEWSKLQATVRGIPGEYALNEAGDALEPALLVRWRKASVAAQEIGEEIPARPDIPADMLEVIELRSQEVRDLAAIHVERNGDRTKKIAGLRTAQGIQYNRGDDVFYPIPPDLKEYQYFATVRDESITSGNHTSTIYAHNEKELKLLTEKVQSSNPQFRVMTKGESEAYFKAEGSWEYEKTFNSNYMDTELSRQGASAPFFVATDPQKIVNDTLKWHMQRETGLVREAVSAKYEAPFRELEMLGKDVTNLATSRFGNFSLRKNVDAVVKNPYQDYIKTALGIRKGEDYPFWQHLNTMADEKMSQLLSRATSVVKGSADEKALDEVSRMLDQGGYKGASYYTDMEIFNTVNSGPERGMLNTLVQRSNSVMATVVLRMDALNAVNNAVSANVLLGAETKAIFRAIAAGDAEAVGALAKLTKIAVPGTGQSMLSPTKMIANSIQKFGKLGAIKGGAYREHPDFKFFADNGYMTRISDQYVDLLEDLTFNPAAGMDSWADGIRRAHGKVNGTAAKIGDTAEAYTGNRLAEEFNRFVAADVMKQMTDVAVSRGLMGTKEQLAYINTFVNRTQGNYLAAQRPGLFQGAIGQAMGLFQTYQFNLMQQLLRHVGEGHTKDAMTLLALQGTIHGMNGLPAFNAVNTHLVGNASGNTAHRDAYDSVYGIAGKEAGDWLMYGAASSALGLLHPDLKVNLYTRGDINPRHLTIVPINPSSVPIVQATGKFLANIWNTASKLNNGGAVTNTILQGLEHNALSRPLAGIAQTLQGVGNVNQASYSTTKQGNVIASNDLLSLANLGRVLGGKPLEEAIALNATYRFKAYSLKDSKLRQTLGNAIKTTMQAGNNPTLEQVEDFAQRYAEMGGRQEEFSGWMTQLYKTANLSEANALRNNLNSPFSQSMQTIMGGRELRDFE